MMVENLEKESIEVKQFMMDATKVFTDSCKEKGISVQLALYHTVAEGYHRTALLPEDIKLHSAYLIRMCNRNIESLEKSFYHSDVI